MGEASGGVDLADSAFHVDPHRTWARLREAAPVHRCRAEDGSPAWVLTRYADIRDAHVDPRFTVDKRASAGGYAGFNLPPELDENLLNRDGDVHRRLRRLVAGAFTPRRIAALRTHIEAVANEHAEQLAAQPTADVVTDYAAMIPIKVIGGLLGVPPEQQGLFRSWVNGMFAHDPNQVRTAIAEIHAFLRGLIDTKRACPSDDLLSDLVTLRDDGDRLDEHELLSTTMLLMLAGYENPVHGIGNATAALLTHRDQWHALQDTPELLPAAVDELLRFGPPAALGIRRFAVQPVTLGGCTIKPGDTVLFGQMAAHRDPRQYDSPDLLDIKRNPSRGMAFGHGVHFCIGAALGHAEIELALAALLRHAPRMTLACDPADLQWRRSTRSRGLLSLPVTLN